MGCCTGSPRNSIVKSLRKKMILLDIEMYLYFVGFDSRTYFFNYKCFYYNLKLFHIQMSILFMNYLVIHTKSSFKFGIVAINLIMVLVVKIFVLAAR